MPRGGSLRDEETCYTSNGTYAEYKLEGTVSIVYPGSLDATLDRTEL